MKLLFLPGESQDGGAWWATVYGIAQSRTRLKRLSSSRSYWVSDSRHCHNPWTKGTRGEIWLKEKTRVKKAAGREMCPACSNLLGES